MKFSICHPTARPYGWQASFDAWVDNFSGSNELEYILGVDMRFGFGDLKELSHYMSCRVDNVTVVENPGRKCLVDNANVTAQCAEGDVLIINSDDMFPPKNWDTLLETALLRQTGSNDFVVQVKSGIEEADKRGLMPLQILSMARYKRLGYALYPDYESLYADDDFGAHARADNAVIDATHITVEHRHPNVGKAKWDEVYSHENRAESSTLGARVFAARKERNFAA